MKVLIIRLSSIGDVILTTPIIRLIKKTLKADIHYLTNEINFPIIEHNPYITSYCKLEDNNQVKRQDFDIVIDLHNSAKSRRITFSKHTQVIRTDKMPLRKWLMLLFRINLLNKTHVVTNHIKVLEHLGISDDGEGLEIFLNPKTTQIEEFSAISNKIVINVGGSKITKRIPKSLVESILTSSTEQYILVGGADVYDNYKDVRHDNLMNLVDQLSLQETLHIIKECKHIITGDTALMHAAAAFAKNQITVWGSTSDDFGFYPYYGSNNQDQSIHITQNLSCQPCSKMGKDRCPKGHMRCLTDISAKEVLLSLNEF